MRNPLKKLQKKINFRLASNAAQHKPRYAGDEKEPTSSSTNTPARGLGREASTTSHTEHELFDREELLTASSRANHSSARLSHTSRDLTPEEDPMNLFGKVKETKSSRLRLALAESKKTANANKASSPASASPKKKKRTGRLSFGGSRKSKTVSSTPTPADGDVDKHETSETENNSPSSNKDGPCTPPRSTSTMDDFINQHTTLSPSSNAHTPASAAADSSSNDGHKRHSFDSPTKSSQMKMRDKIETPPSKPKQNNNTPSPAKESLSSIITIEVAKTPPRFASGPPSIKDKTSLAGKSVLDVGAARLSVNSKSPPRSVVAAAKRQSNRAVGGRSKADSKQMMNPTLERIAKAAAALDNTGNELFEKGEYDKAMAQYVKALKLKNRSLMNAQTNDDEEECKDPAARGGGLAPVPEDAKNNPGNLISLSSSSISPQNDPSSKPSAEGADDLWISVATSINNIGYLRQQSGQASAEETMQAYENSLQIKRRVLGNDNLSVGKTLNNLGTVHYLKRDYDQALQAYREALQIMMASLGPDHLDVGTVHSNIGDVYWAQSGDTTNVGDSPQRSYQASRNAALRHYRQSLEIRWEQLHNHHDPKVIRLLEKIAALEMGESFLALVQKSHRHRQSPKSGEDAGDSKEGADAKEGETYVDPDETIESASHPHVQEELQSLHREVVQDVKKIDLMERKLAIDMVKDKLRLIREMKKLHTLNLYESDDEMSLFGEDSVISTPPAPLSPEQRVEALSAVKTRLKQLRDAREREGAPGFRDAPVSDLKEADRSPSNYYMSQKASQILNRTLHQHSSPSQSSLDEIRKFAFKEDEVEVPKSNIPVYHRAAGALEEGIDALRNLSFNHENQQNSGNIANGWHVPEMPMEKSATPVPVTGP